MFLAVAGKSLTAFRLQQANPIQIRFLLKSVSTECPNRMWFSADPSVHLLRLKVTTALSSTTGSGAIQSHWCVSGCSLKVD